MTTLPETAKHPVITRSLAVGLLGFVALGLVTFTLVGPGGKTALLLGLVGGTTVCGLLGGRAFLRLQRALPEALLLATWVSFAIGSGHLWESLSVNGALLFLVLAPMFAALASLWAAIRLIQSPTLQAVVSVVAGLASLLFCLVAIAKL